MKNLYIPYLTVNLIWYLLSDLLFIFQNGTGAVDWVLTYQQIRNVILFSGDVTVVTIATWFFKTLFWVVILYDLLNRFLHGTVLTEKKIAVIRLLILFGLLFFGWLEKILLNNYWGNIFCTMILFEVGQYIKKGLENKKIVAVQSNLLLCAALVVSLLILLPMRHSRIELSQNEIVNPLFFLGGAIAGFVLLYAIDQLVIAHCKAIETALSYIGRHSVWIVTLHLFAFRIVAWIQIKCYGLPMTEIGNLFRPITAPYWWIAYTAVGIVVPLLGKKGFDLFKRRT